MSDVAEYIDVTKLPSLPLLEKAQLPAIACVYLVVDELHDIHYVGGTTNLLNRWKNHQKFRQAQELEQPRIVYLEVFPHLVWDVEAFLIRMLQPRLNIQIPSESELVHADII